MVGHNLRMELSLVAQCLRQEAEQIASIAAMLNTEIIAEEVLGRGFSLSALVGEDGCSAERTEEFHMQFHSGGNDAFFTLRALLMLAVRSKANSNLSPNARSKLATLQAVASGTFAILRPDERKGRRGEGE